MARTLTEIYSEAKQYRNRYLELTEYSNISNSSKMSIMDAFTWTAAACIWSFENILDIFKVDLAKDLQNRVNGTAAYYAQALLKYQSGDTLQMNEDGTIFSYAETNTSKRIITKVSYSEETVANFLDKDLILKIATGEAGAYERIDDEELIKIRAYAQQISFAGTHMTIVSRKGDVLIPRVTVYYDGTVEESEMYSLIEDSLNNFIAGIDFNGAVYVQKIIDAIQCTEHVTDVYVNNTANDTQGIFVAQYNDDNNLIEVTPGVVERKIDRMFIPNSGFIKQSSGQDEESNLETWRSAITLRIEE